MASLSHQPIVVVELHGDLVGQGPLSCLLEQAARYLALKNNLLLYQVAFFDKIL